MDLDEYLNQPCEADGCDRIGTHHQAGRTVCNQHLERDLPARATND